MKTGNREGRKEETVEDGEKKERKEQKNRKEKGKKNQGIGREMEGERRKYERLKE